MKKSTALILAGLCAAGLLSGFAVRRAFSGNPKSADTGEKITPSAEIPREKPAATPANAALPEIPLTRSTDTVESILAVDPAGNYARIALWLATASEQDIAAYWAGCKKGSRKVDVHDLIFINWTRRNPQAALAAVAGTWDERYVWWSWAGNDPEAALAAVKSAGYDQVVQVVSGIGHSNPDWLRTHLDRIPAEIRSEALDRIKNFPGGQDPLASLKFMKENGLDDEYLAFQSLARKDPWAAFDWIKENPDGRPFSNNDGRMDVLASTMARENPEELERLAAGLPQGAARRTMEQALFDHLLETDPAAALEQARAVEAPLVAAQRLAQIGLGMISTDPDKAFEIAREILAANPETLDIKNWVEYENGSISSGNPGKATELMDALFAKDREKTLAAMGVQLTGESNTQETFSKYASKWAEDDLEDFMDWTDQQSGAVQQASSEQIGYKLVKQGDYTGALEWAGLGDPDPGQAYSYLLSHWQAADPAAAAAWLENSGLTNEQKAHYRDFLKRAAQ